MGIYEESSLRKKLAILSLLLACGVEDTENSSVLNDSAHTFWEREFSRGDKENFAIESKAYIKNDGTDLNRQTTVRLYLDSWFFGRKFLDESPEGNIFDFTATINRGKLSSYTYLRFLNKTKYSNSSAKPELNFDIIRKSVSSRRKIPLLSQANATINVSAGIKASIDTKFSITSPEPYALDGNFEPDVLIKANFSSKFDPKYWAKASITGDLVLFKYQLKSAISTSYDETSSQLSSLIKISKNQFSALVGKLKLRASLTPEHVPYLAKVFNIEFKALTKFVNDLKLKLSKRLFKFVTGNDEGWTFERVVFNGSAAKNEQLYTGTLSDVKFLSGAQDYLSCKDRAKRLIEDSRKLNETLKVIAQSEENFDEGYKISKRIKAQLDEAREELEKCEKLR